MKKLSNYLKRIKNVQKVLKTEKIHALLIEKPIDLFYLTGMQMSLGNLFISQTKARLFVDGRYLEMAKRQSPVSVEEMNQANIMEFLKGAKTLAFDGDWMTYTHFIQWKKIARKSKCKLLSKPQILKSLRLIKDTSEIQKMKKSAQFAYAAYQWIRKKVHPGVTEIDLARDLQLYCLEKGAEKMSFDPIIAFGKNTALPHHHPGKTKCRENEIILFDLGVVLEAYASDMTRVDFIGKIDPQLQHLYDINKAAQKAALAKCRPGVSLKEVDQAARSVMAHAGLEDYFIHSLGHGVGLEVHESPRIKFDGPDRNCKLEEGMVLTIEPGLYLPGKGGVRYEDTIVITPSGYQNLYTK